MARRILSLDINDRHATMVMIRAGIRDAHVEFYDRLALANRDADLPDVFDDLLSRLPQPAGLSGVSCRAALPAEDISFRHITLPFAGTGKIRQVLPFELEPLLPFAVEEVQTGFSTITGMSSPHHTAVLAAAISRERLSTVIDLFAARKLVLEQVSVSGYAKAQHLARTWRPDADWVFLDRHASACTLFVCTAGDVAMVRPLPPPDTSSQAVAALGDQIVQTLTAVEDRHGTAGHPELIVIGGTRVPGDADQGLLAARTGLPVIHAPSSNGGPLHFDRPPEDEAIRRQVDNAVALALPDAVGKQPLNFMTGGFSPLKKWAEHRGRLIRTAILAAVVLLIALGKTGYEVHLLLQQRMVQDRQMTEIFKSVFPQVTRIEDPYKQMQIALRELKKTPLTAERYAGDTRVIDILDQIGRHTTNRRQVRLSTILINPGQVDITGTTDSFNAVDALKGRLSGSPLFRDVTIGSAKLAKDQNRVNFKLRMTL